MVLDYYPESQERFCDGAHMWCKRVGCIFSNLIKFINVEFHGVVAHLLVYFHLVHPGFWVLIFPYPSGSSYLEFGINVFESRSFGHKGAFGLRSSDIGFGELVNSHFSDGQIEYSRKR